MGGFPGGTVVESSPADAGDTGSCPSPGRSHMPQSGWAREPWPLSLRIRSLCSATGEAATVRVPRNTQKKENPQNNPGETPVSDDEVRQRRSFVLEPAATIDQPMKLFPGIPRMN